MRVPGLHPDGRAEAGELTDDELYPSDAQWAGICDRMFSLTPQESARRRRLAAAYGD